MICEVIVGVMVLVLSHLASGLSEAYDKTNERNTGSSSRKPQETDAPSGENTQRGDERLTEPLLNKQDDHVQLSQDTDQPHQFCESNQGDTGSTSEESQQTGSSSGKVIHKEHEQVDGSIGSPHTGYNTEDEQGNRIWCLPETEAGHFLGEDQQIEISSTSEISQESDMQGSEMFHQEYEHLDWSYDSSPTDPESHSDTPTDTTDEIVIITFSNNHSPGLWQSLKRTLVASFTIMFVALALGVFGVLLLYFDLSASDLCFEWNHRFGNLSIEITAWNLFGEVIQDVFINLWFPATMALLFGWGEFKSNYFSTMYVGLATAGTLAIYKVFLLFFGVFGTEVSYRYPGNALFIVGIICSSVLVAQRIHSLRSSVACSSVAATAEITANRFITSFVCGMIYRYSAVPRFTETKNEIMKVVLAASPPLMALIPTALSKHVVLRYTPGIIQRGRGFVLVYFPHGIGIILYRTMQAHFNSIWIFIGLSLIHSFLNFSGKATREFLVRMWTHLIVRLKNRSMSRRLEPPPRDTPEHRRLKADLEIQDMIFEDTALILSQAYRVLYLVTNFENSHGAVLKEGLFRVFIGLGIDFIFNCLSISVQIRWFNIPVRIVWLKTWKLHMVAHAITITVTVCYFSQVLLSIFQDTYAGYTIRNCA